ncbi:hypothetical protein Tsubulata_046972 [Turnera subulata]|uniref:Uncharacterized protein n=1 Tax=Turnera subulata TaxID=218843 RepID=A0A9Q0F0B9_9ROSI|nr:hypothetical protein Tsubulata_046972 [Turnera subulata]
MSRGRDVFLPTHPRDGGSREADRRQGKGKGEARVVEQRKETGAVSRGCWRDMEQSEGGEVCPSVHGGGTSSDLRWCLPGYSGGDGQGKMKKEQGRG